MKWHSASGILAARDYYFCKHVSPSLELRATSLFLRGSFCEPQKILVKKSKNRDKALIRYLP